MRGVSLISLDRPADALAAFTTARSLDNGVLHAQWVGTAHYYRGQYAEAVNQLRESVQAASGEQRDFGILWLYFAAERAQRGGHAAITPFLSGSDGERWSGKLVQYIQGRLSQDELLQAASRERERERLNLTEAYFFIGKVLASRGDSDGARRMFEKAIEQNAQPYRETALAQLELKRLRR